MHRHDLGKKHCLELLPEILRYSALAFLNTTGQHLRSRIDPFVITAFVGVASVPVYNMGLRLITLFSDLINAIMGGPLLAGFSHVEGRDGLDGVLRKFLFSLRFSIPLALFGATGLTLLGPPFLVRWVGPVFEGSGTVLRLLVLPYTLWLMQFPAGSLFLSLNKHHLITKLTFAFGILNVLLSIALASLFGFYGVVWATFVDMTLFYGLIVPILVTRVLKIQLTEYFRILLTPAIKLGVIFATIGLLIQPWHLTSYTSMLAAAVMLIAIFVFTGPLLLLSRSERLWLALRLRSYWKREAQ